MTNTKKFNITQTPQAFAGFFVFLFCTLVQIAQEKIKIDFVHVEYNAHHYKKIKMRQMQLEHKRLINLSHSMATSSSQWCTLARTSDMPVGLTIDRKQKRPEDLFA